MPKLFKSTEEETVPAAYSSTSMFPSHQGISIPCSGASLPDHSLHGHHRESCTPVTPDGRSSTAAPGPCPDGGIALRDASLAHASVSRPANTRVRRSRHDSELLQSPARPGHAARMRQIFEDASLQRNREDVLYPQLPNISRKASTQAHQDQGLPRRNFTVCRPESLCMATSSLQIAAQQHYTNHSPVSEGTSESWSDDSGYFISGSRTMLAVTPKERISDWLAGLEDASDVSEAASKDRCNGRDSLHLTSYEVEDEDALTTTQPLSEEHTYVPSIRTQTWPNDLDPFLQAPPDSNPSLLTTLRHPRPFSPRTNTPPPTVIIRPHHPSTARPICDEGGIQLSPLSPNVCLERGPARYHVTRRHDPTPTKYRDRENTGVGLAGGSRSESAEGSPCKIGAGTRFQHPRHHARFDLSTEF